MVLHLYNRWKGGALTTISSRLVDYLRNHEDTHYLIEQNEIKNIDGLLQALNDAETDFMYSHIKEQFSYEGKKTLRCQFCRSKIESCICQQ